MPGLNISEIHRRVGGPPQTLLFTQDSVPTVQLRSERTLIRGREERRQSSDQFITLSRRVHPLQDTPLLKSSHNTPRVSPMPASMRPQSTPAAALIRLDTASSVARATPIARQPNVSADASSALYCGGNSSHYSGTASEDRADESPASFKSVADRVKSYVAGNSSSDSSLR